QGNVWLPARKGGRRPAPLPPLAGHPTVSRSPAGSVAPSTRRGPLAQSAPVRRQDPTAAMTQPFPATTRRRNRTFQAGGCPALPVLKCVARSTIVLETARLVAIPLVGEGQNCRVRDKVGDKSVAADGRAGLVRSRSFHASHPPGDLRRRGTRDPAPAISGRRRRRRGSRIDARASRSALDRRRRRRRC